MAGATMVDDPPPSRFTWKINNLSSITTKAHESNVFLADDCRWLLRIYPKGNNVSQLSLYLAADATGLPDGWSRDVKFSLAVINQLNNKLTVRKGVREKFTATGSSRGWQSFIPLTEFNDPAKGYIVKDTCILEAEITVVSAIPAKQGSSVMSLPTDVKEYLDSYSFAVEMPGVKPGDIKLQLVNDDKVLLINGEKRREIEKGVKYLTTERKFGTFSRSLTLPEDSDVDGISAFYKDGVLTVTVDKQEPKKPRTVMVKVT